jgi:hypothetical protein
MADIKLDYVNSFYDARGKLRHTFPLPTSALLAQRLAPSTR